MTEQPATPRRTSVRIDTPGVTVQVDADEPMDKVTKRALQLYRDAGGCPDLGRGAVGFVPTREGNES